MVTAYAQHSGGVNAIMLIFTRRFTEALLKLPTSNMHGEPETALMLLYHAACVMISARCFSTQGGTGPAHANASACTTRRGNSDAVE